MPISRRAFLRTQSALVTLPFMPSAVRSLTAATKSDISQAMTPSKKLIMMYVPNGIVRRSFFPGEEDRALPGFKGGFSGNRGKNKREQMKPGNYPIEWTRTLQPLKEAHARDITFITGLDRSYKEGQDVHAQAASCYLTSVSPGQAKEKGWLYPNGRSLDQVIGDHVGDNAILRTLEISCNGFTNNKESIYWDNISWYGPGKIAPSIKDPQKLYDRLFMRESYRKHVKQVSDLVFADAKALANQLAQEDRYVMDEFMTMMRDIEKRIEKLEAKINDAPMGRPAHESRPRGEYIQLMGDMMIMAMKMGMTNVSTFMIGPERWDSALMYEGVFKDPVQHHNMSHNQKNNGWIKLQKIDDFHMKQYAYVLSKMKEIKEADGSSLFDNSIITYGAGMGDGATHQFYDLPMIIGGGAQGQIKQGKFLRCKNGTLNSNLWLTIAQMMGVEINTFADSTGTIAI